jgi:hypothetical protein
VSRSGFPPPANWPRPFCRPKPSPLRVTGALLALAAVIGAVAWIVGWVR